MIGLVVQLALLLQLFGGRRGDDVLNMSLMHTTLEQQPVDLDELNFVGPSPATILKFAMAMNKVSSACLVQGPHHGYSVHLVLATITSCLKQVDITMSTQELLPAQVMYNILQLNILAKPLLTGVMPAV